MFNLNPKEDKFYEMFENAAKNVHEGAKLLRTNMDDLSDIDKKIAELEKLEHDGDKIVHDIIEALNNSFITPLDREDIFAITKVMDDIIDNIESTMHRFGMFNIIKATEEAKVLCDMVVDATQDIIYIVKDIKNMGKGNILNQKIIRVNQIENDGDKYYRGVIKDLFANEKDTLNIIKWREIYQFLENTIDSCEKVANIIEGVVMKHA